MQYIKVKGLEVSQTNRPGYHSCDKFFLTRKFAFPYVFFDAFKGVGFLEKIQTLRKESIKTLIGRLGPERKIETLKLFEKPKIETGQI